MYYTHHDFLLSVFLHGLKQFDKNVNYTINNHSDSILQISSNLYIKTFKYELILSQLNSNFFKIETIKNISDYVYNFDKNSILIVGCSKIKINLSSGTSIYCLPLIIQFDLETYISKLTDELKYPIFISSYR